jgi:RND family efflux transporter MFP subunit
LETTISLEGLKQVDVYSRVSGRLSALLFKEGDRVKRSQTLFKIDRTDPGENFLATPVESPVDGWIAKWNVGEGTQITTQIPIVQIVDDHLLRATVSLPSKDWSQVSMRTEVFAVTNNQTRKARVVGVSRAADPASGRGTFEIEVNNFSREWRAGMTGFARIHLNPKPRILIPAKALVLTDMGAFVYAVENGTAQRKPVRYEMLNNDTLEIVEGLEGETLVITAGANNISQGAPVRIVTNSRSETEEKPSPKRKGP